MQTIDEAREHCWFVDMGIEKMAADGEDLVAKLAAALPPHFAKSGGK